MSIGVNDTGSIDVLTQCAAFDAGVGIEIPGGPGHRPAVQHGRARTRRAELDRQYRVTEELHNPGVQLPQGEE